MSVAANIDVVVRGNTQDLDKSLQKGTQSLTNFQSRVTNIGASIKAGFGKIGRTAHSAVSGILGSFPQGDKLNRAFDGLLQTLSSVWQALKGVGEAMFGMFQKSADAMKKGFTDLKEGLKGIIDGLLTTVTNLALAWYSMGKAGIQNISDINKSAMKLGVPFNDMVVLAYKAKMPVEELDASLAKIQKNLAEPSPELSNVLQKIGLNAKELVNLNMVDAVGQIGDALDKVGNAADRTALEMELAGRGGANMWKLWSGGSAGIKDAANATKELGLQLEADQQNAVIRAKKAMSELGRAWTGVMNTAAITIAPLVEWFNRKLTDGLKWFTSHRDTVVSWSKSLVFVFDHIGDYWNLMWLRMKKNMMETMIAMTAEAKFVVRGIQNILKGNFAETEEERQAYANDKNPYKNPDYVKVANEFGKLSQRLRKGWDASFKTNTDKLNEERAPVAKSILSGMNEDKKKKNENKAAIYGSDEAFSIIAKAQGDKMYKVANNTLQETKKVVKVLNDIKNKKHRGQQVKAGRF